MDSDDITERTVVRTARLARLHLDPLELPGLAHDLKKILEHVRSFEQLDLTNVVATTHLHGLASPTRPDLVQTSLPVETVMLNAPEREGDAFKVAKVIG